MQSRNFSTDLRFILTVSDAKILESKQTIKLNIHLECFAIRKDLFSVNNKKEKVSSFILPELIYW